MRSQLKRPLAAKVKVRFTAAPISARGRYLPTIGDGSTGRFYCVDRPLKPRCVAAPLLPRVIRSEQAAGIDCNRSLD
jgi:hypothetical protein